jgi:hypothetical protein
MKIGDRGRGRFVILMSFLKCAGQVGSLRFDAVWLRIGGGGDFEDDG